MTSPRNERGQVFVLTVFTLAVLLGMTGLVLDVGSWFRTKRQLQATADAAALAGAQALPDSPGNATSLALSYAGQNGGGVLGSDVTISSTGSGIDNTISVAAKRQNPGIFSKALCHAVPGCGSKFDVVDIAARATAIVGVPAQALHVAPMVVNCNHTLIKNCSNGNKLPQFNVPTTLTYGNLGAPGSFGMINLNGSIGTQGTSVESAWILTGYNRYLPTGLYNSDPGAKFSSNDIQSALQARLNSVLLFPVYSKLNGTGQNAQYTVIGWIGFYLTGFKMKGNNATLTGYFTTYIAQGILAGSGNGNGNGNNGTPDYGVKSIQLIQ